MTARIDLQQLFQLPIRHIVVEEDSIDDLSGMVEEEKNNSDYQMVYQPVKLNKVIGTRSSESGEFEALDYAEGFKPIEPDVLFKQSLLTDLMYDPGEPEKCELLVVVSMYNEGATHFKNTMCGIANNLKTFVKFGIHPKKIGVVNIVDGLVPFFATMTGEDNKPNKALFSQFFDENMIKERFGVDDCAKCEVTKQDKHTEIAHIFMQTIVMDDSHMFPLQLFFTIKQLNKRKLNSHLWFLGGFCEMIQPQYIMLIDVGTKPLKDSLFSLYEAMKLNPNLGGCCGEIIPMGHTLWKLVVPAQEVEYKFSHIFDKALESLVGYITVLPGAFSAYRWEAIKGSPIWEDYFFAITHPEEMSPFMSNIYLAEDRVLCLSIVSKKNSKYTLRYVRSSVAKTDIPQTLSELMSQRRRWINGSWFGLVNSLQNFSRVHKSSHSCFRRCLFVMLMIYYYLSVLFSWFMVGAFYITFAITVDNEFGNTMGSLGTWVMVLYITMLLIVTILALSVKPWRARDLYKGISVVFGLFMLIGAYMLILYVLVDLGKQDSITWARILTFFALLLFSLNVIANGSCGKVSKGLFHFLFMVPTYVNVFYIFAICNCHDCSWGNRPDAANVEKKGNSDDYEEFRARWTIFWGMSNGIFGFFIKAFNDEGDEPKGYYVFLISAFGLAFLTIKTLAGLIYILNEKRLDRKAKKGKTNDLYEQFEAEAKVQNTKEEQSRVMSIIAATEPKETSLNFVQEFSEFTENSFEGGEDESLDDDDEDYFEESYARNPSVAKDELSQSEELSDIINSASSRSKEASNREDEQDSLDEMDCAELIRYGQDELNISLEHLAEEADIDVDRLRMIEEGEIIADPQETDRLFDVVNNY